jgi:hypothetical protein
MYKFISKNKCPECNYREWYCYFTIQGETRSIRLEIRKSIGLFILVEPIVDSTPLNYLHNIFGRVSYFDECINCGLVVS